MTLLNDEQATVSQDITVAPHDRTVLDLDAQLTGQIVSAVVEVDGGGAIVEQRAFDPAGTAVSPCANSTSATWYLADGFTVGESRNQIVLTNPYDDAVIVDVGFATVDGSRTPSRYQGYPIEGHSVKIIDLGVSGEGAQGEEVLAVKVESTRGQLIVGRLQHFDVGRPARVHDVARRARVAGTVVVRRRREGERDRRALQPVQPDRRRRLRRRGVPRRDLRLTRSDHRARPPGRDVRSG